MRRRAILIAPTEDPIYLADVAALCFALQAHRGYQRRDIAVLVGADDQVRDPGDGRPRMCRDARMRGLRSALREAADLGADDLLFVAVAGHGDGPPDGPPEDLIEMAAGRRLTSSELAVELRPLPCRKLLLLGTCYGGSFPGAPFPRTTIVSACSAGEVSWSTPNRTRTEFLMHFTNALADPTATVAACFEHARNHDRWAQPGAVAPRRETPLLWDPDGVAGTLRV